MNDKVREWLGELLILKIGEYSEDNYAAGWYHNIEYIVWRKGRNSTGDPQAEACVELGKHLDGWPTWDETLGKEVLLPLSVWQERYGRWLDDGTY